MSQEEKRIKLCREYEFSMLIDKDMDSLSHYLTADAFQTDAFGVSIGYEQIHSGLDILNECFETKDILITDSASLSNTTILDLSVKMIHQSDFLGIPPTGKEIQLDCQMIYKWKNDKVSAIYAEVDVKKWGSQLTNNAIVFDSHSSNSSEAVLLHKIMFKIKEHDLTLTNQELRCIILQAYGLKSNLMAKVFSCSLNTVRTHIKNAQCKFNEQINYGSFVSVFHDLNINELVDRYARCLLIKKLGY